MSAEPKRAKRVSFEVWDFLGLGAQDFSLVSLDVFVYTI